MSIVVLQSGQAIMGGLLATTLSAVAISGAVAALAVGAEMMNVS